MTRAWGLVAPVSGPRAPEGLTAAHLVPQELKLKDEECERLSRVREQLERELEELTASLFEVRWPAGPLGPGCWASIGSSPLPSSRKPTRWCEKPTRSRRRQKSS